jgi:hypothetical protein
VADDIKKSDQLPEDTAVEAPAVAEAAQPVATPEAPEIPGDKPIDIYDISGEKPVLGSIPRSQLHDALASGKFSLPQGAQLNVINPDGQFGSIPAEQAFTAIQEGFKVASRHDELKAEYGDSLGQQTLAGAEGALRGLVSRPIAEMIEEGLGSDAEARRFREEEYAKTAMTGEIGSLVGSALLTGGSSLALKAPMLAKAAQFTQAGVLSKISSIAGVGEKASTAMKIGSLAARSMIENGIQQSGDEIGKRMFSDPGSSVESSLLRIGAATALGGIIGGGFGAISPLWKATIGPKAEEKLAQVMRRIDGTPSVPVAELDDLAKTAEVEIPSSIRGAHAAEDPEAFALMRREKHANVEADVTKFQEDTAKSVLKTIGEPAERAATGDVATGGREAIETLKTSIRKKYAPLINEYETFKKQFSDVELPKGQDAIELMNIPAIPGAAEALHTEVYGLAQKMGYLEDGRVERGIVQTVLKRVAKAKNVNDLSDILKVIHKATKGNRELADVGYNLKQLVLNQVFGFF